ncbi:MAG: hypothetical protein BMS9Abin08_1610 [Gammaproteobacteria bacterium]|nr:MAG: hypothetical protein BMS9Abin08_1610 [Gammaproteobacteria bacterium]
MIDPDTRVWLGEDGIVRIEYPQDFNLTLQVMQAVNQQHRRITTDRRPVLVYAESVASAEYEAQQFASTEQAIELTTCLAIIVKSFFTRAMAELFMKFHKPPYPTRVFNDEKAALVWLETFLPDETGVSGSRQ